MQNRSVFLGVFTAFLLLAVVWPRPVDAQEKRIYFAGYMGLNTYGDFDFSESATPARGTIEPDNGYHLAGALGLRLSKQVRVEAELSYNKTDMDRIDISGSGSFDLGGDMRSWLGMANLYYDFDVDWPVQPYIGAGIGYGLYDLNINDSSGFTSDASGDAYAFTWQVGGGLKYRVSDTLAFTGGYRYLDSSDLDIGDYNIDYSNHQFRIGLEYALPFE